MAIWQTTSDSKGKRWRVYVGIPGKLDLVNKNREEGVRKMDEKRSLVRRKCIIHA